MLVVGCVVVVVLCWLSLSCHIVLDLGCVGGECMGRCGVWGVQACVGVGGFVGWLFVNSH